MRRPETSVQTPPDVILHIGSGKTGTTTIQHFLRRNRRRLADLADVLVPTAPGRRRHVKLGLSLLSDEAMVDKVAYHRHGAASPTAFREQFHRELEQEIRDAGRSRVLLSDEALYGAPPYSLELLRGHLDRIGGRRRVVVYLRRQDDHLASRYQQVVKVGEVRRLAQRVQEMDYSATYDYDARLRLWRDRVAPDELVVRRFGREYFPDGSLLRDFLDATGIDLPLEDDDTVAPRNESLDAESVEFLRLLNIHLVTDQGVHPRRISHQGTVRRLAGHSTGPTLTLPERDLTVFMERWAEPNRRVARTFLGIEDGTLFAPPRRSRRTTSEQRLDPARLPHFLDLAEIAAGSHAPLRRIAEREAAGE